MKVFLTGATGYIGSAVARALQANGHTVVGLARTDAAEAKLRERGVTPVRGELTDAAAITEAARNADGVIHTAASPGPDMADADRIATTAILAALDGTDKPFVYTNGTLAVGDTGAATLDETAPNNPPPFLAWRVAVETDVLTAQGVRGVAIRPPMVYGNGGGAFGAFIGMARQEGFGRYVGGGDNAWSTVHVDDLADLYVRALESASAGSLYIGASDEALTLKEVAEAVSHAGGGAGKIQAWPVEEAAKVFGPLAYVLTLNSRVSGAKARRELGWTPKAPSFRDDAMQSV